LSHFAFSSSERTLLIIGGSLGARTINESILAGIDKLIDARVQVIWQTGKIYFDNIKQQIETIQQFTGKSINENELLNESNAVVLNEKIPCCSFDCSCFFFL
jgi:UDP-N-acetylglucosamine--N-acetylmuramyl-(pentapeptide) pyrophosphoryl-undecaprenol N-acetylglucosamine transferase